MQRFYFDTSIWIGIYEGRLGYNNESLSNPGLNLLFSLLKGNSKLIVTDLLVKELSKHYSLEQINGIFMPFEGIIEKVTATKQQEEESRRIAKEINLPLGDVMHAVTSRDNNLIFITRDNHFRMLKDIWGYFRPEDFF